MNGFTEDRFLDGRVLAWQPERGFRSGLDAVMLAAAVPAAEGDEILELGCGVGVASLCLATRCSACEITGIDVLPELVDRAGANARANKLAPRMRFVAGDALSPPPALRREYDHVFSNPPFHDDAGQQSPSADRKVALSDDGRLQQWLSSGLARTRSQGTFSVIFRADRLAEVLSHLPALGVTLFPLWPRQGEPAKRVIVQIRKGSRAPLTILAGLVLHERDGANTPAADAVLRDGGSLALANRPL